MKTLAFGLRALALLVVVGFTATLSGGGSPLGYVKSKTFQNLAPMPCKFHGHYLAIDDAGLTALAPVSNKFESNSYWEVKYAFWKDRGYMTHMLVQRGNNPYNGQYLTLDGVTGKLGYAKEAVPEGRWLIRYAGKYHGWDSFHIQNLAEGPLGMAFLAIDEVTGEVILSAKPIPSSNWFMNDTAYLPAETVIP
jgi:hypothetical protein